MGRGRRSDRPTIKRAKGKAFHTHHHRALRIIFKEIKIATTADGVGRLARVDVPRLMKRAFPDLPKKHVYRHYYDRWIGRFKDKRPKEWFHIDRPNERNTDPYTEDELAEFDRIRGLIGQAADDLDLELPWAEDGETANDEEQEDGDVDGENMGDETDEEEADLEEADIEDNGDEEEDVDLDQDQDMEDSDDGSHEEWGVHEASHARAQGEDEFQELPGAIEEVGNKEAGPSQASPSAVVGAAGHIITIADSDTTDGLTLEPSDTITPGAVQFEDFDVRNARLLEARVERMNQELDDMDWTLPRAARTAGAAAADARPRQEAPCAVQSDQYGRIMTQLKDADDPFVRCCGDWGDKILGRSLLHMGDGDEEEQLFGFKTTI
ncbi:hypothetical protein M409DRAFT_60391 [Zasmidium cellare ATCC 36951]|uniref:Uncharacterized protein n=1 Tax=Zasmidium cellare ATCC 36951 TaxID=1080233 RepID=A0A6A6C1G1_ZASCE|nr:uncharacterized protein M409DRAFT_60391 [Zasmidium cellare ATCC 36951]KAF2159990.1 hypothetical protein M409DRAFT_60391 [Zasmidium cellare ATCC 36951]